MKRLLPILLLVLLSGFHYISHAITREEILARYPDATEADIKVTLEFYNQQGIHSNCEKVEDGAKLYLNRGGGIETFRAQFCYAQDCRLIAKNMSRIEIASWYCK